MQEQPRWQARFASSITSTLMAPDKPGEGARVLNTLKEAGVNLLAFSGFPKARRAQVDFFPADAAAFKQAARKAKWKIVGPKRGFLLQGDDRVGAVAELLGRLGAANINVTAIDAVAVDGRYGAIFWVAPKDVKKTAAPARRKTCHSPGSSR
jgi:hypothetical protein